LLEQSAAEHAVEQSHPRPARQVVVAGPGLGQGGRLAGLAQRAHRQRRADQAEGLDGRRDLVAGQPVVTVPALLGDGDQAARRRDVGVIREALGGTVMSRR
jgi:hypothetical protein